MTYEEKIDEIRAVCNNMDCLCQLFVDPSYPSALIGYTIQGDQVKAVYSEKKILEELQSLNNWSGSEAYEWYEYNVLGSHPDCIIVNMFTEDNIIDE